MNNNTATITEIFNTLNPDTDGASIKYQNYLDIYEEKFKHIKNNPINILEIGIEKGGSLTLWQKYFTHPDTKVVGVDIVSGCKQRERNNITVLIGDQKDTHFLSEVASLGPYDIIIDDGGHHTEQHNTSFLQLFKTALKINGLYCIEDLHTCYMKEFETSDKKTFIDQATHLLPLVMIGSANTYFDNEIQSIEFYNSLVLIRRGFQPAENMKSPGFDSVPYPIR